ncbi:MAG: replicative DNA helicase [Candidatus Neomarinimicrobiota bacterium]|nr:replicative DNA helicase [Candidatus Neomarinimicrobiota bacterium]RKY49121.1 MAG: replicative DNA helicase [Candidatus Neomarinimicrobiota bacterium]RKY50831.1 MAG: replicative DNA helicase [Candidatus Neomarinimicrobiota bacterium]HDN59104.1 replicative DNA helicase [Candidatus Neomarinimicrobiota bacterium]
MAGNRTKADLADSADTLRVPPHSLEAEQSVLGAMMLEKEAVSKAIQYLEPSDFYTAQHQVIFKAMIDLFNEGQPVDQVSVVDRLDKNGSLEVAGGAYYITGLVESTPSAANIEYHAQIVLEKSILRKLIMAANEIQAEAYDGREDVFYVLDKAEERIFALSEKRLKVGFRKFDEVLSKTFEYLDAIHNRRWDTTGVPTGLSDLDNLTSGFHNGDLIIIAGRPGMGKTALALTIARNAAVNWQIPVGFFSLEMPDYQIAMRLLCAEARVDSQLVRSGRLPKEQWSKLSVKSGILANAPIYIDDSPALTMLEIRAKARRLKAEKDAKIIFVDYLQLIRSTRSAESRQQEIAEISRGLKAMAKELDIPVVALSQLSRAPEQRGGDHRPQLSDLRESGAIEQDADVVIFIYRPVVYMKGKERETASPEVEKLAEIIVAKQRNGPPGTVKSVFIDRYARFENYSPPRAEVVSGPF